MADGVSARPGPDRLPVPGAARLSADAVLFCSELIAIDTSNVGGADGANERPAAEYVARRLDEAGIASELIESAPGRASVVCRVPGSDPSLPALLVHGHLDVVPADAAQWRGDPFSGEIRDGLILGRGAVDMKNMDAMMLSVARHLRRTGTRPRRDLVLAWLADEEAGGDWGARHLIERRPDLIEGCTTAISEVGGFSVTGADGRHTYLVETGQKGVAWLRLRARGTGGHGSLVHRDTAVQRLAEAVARIGRHDWPQAAGPRMQALLDEFATGGAESGTGVARWLRAAVRHTANVTGLDARGKINIVPGEAVAQVDGRYLPDRLDEFLETVASLADGCDVEPLRLEPGYSNPLAPDFAGAALAALRAEDPSARVRSVRMPTGTDNRLFHRHGLTAYGFVPMRLPDGFDLAGMFHQVDERVPVGAVEFGARVLFRLLSEF